MTILNAHRGLRHLLAATSIAGLVGVSAMGPLATTSLAQPAPQCQLSAEFTAIVAKIGTTAIGDCTANELGGVSGGDRFQTTTRGLLIASADHWTAFTDGQTTWVDNANGLVSVGAQSS
jgi:hypothetical protein